MVWKEAQHDSEAHVQTEKLLEHMASAPLSGPTIARLVVTMVKNFRYIPGADFCGGYLRPEAFIFPNAALRRAVVSHHTTRDPETRDETERVSINIPQLALANAEFRGKIPRIEYREMEERTPNGRILSYSAILYPQVTRTSVLQAGLRRLREDRSLSNELRTLAKIGAPAVELSGGWNRETLSFVLRQRIPEDRPKEDSLMYGSKAKALYEFPVLENREFLKYAAPEPERRRR